jgi:hypothetical protein
LVVHCCFIYHKSHADWAGVEIAVRDLFDDAVCVSHCMECRISCEFMIGENVEERDYTN